jgi:photosystem II stability/assembly factor-like uncharacterized protein
LDAGRTWRPISDDQSSLAIGAITISPDGKTIYAGTGEPNLSGDSYYGDGLLKSSDGGSTWAVLGSNIFAKSAISRIIVSPTNPDQILVLTTYASCCKGLALGGFPTDGFGMFLSTDGGSTWKQVSLPGEYSIADIAADLTNGNTVYAVAGDASIWESPDGGSTWNLRIAANYSLSTLRVVIAPTILTNHILVAYTYGPSVEIMSYDLSAQTAKPLAVPGYACGGAEAQCWYDLVLVTDPSNPNIIYFGGVTLFRSSDGGSTWTDVTPPHVDQHALVFSPASNSTIFIGNDGGVWASSDYGNNWVDLNNGLDITQFESIAASPSSNSLIIGGTQDNGCLAYSGSSLAWNEMWRGDGGWTGIDPTNPNIMYCNYIHLDFQKSSDGGLTWYSATNGLNTNDGSLFYAPVAQDPNNAGTLYIGGTHIYKTTDFANTWNDVSGELGVGYISALAVSPSDDGKIVYGGSEAGAIVESLDGGSTWKTTFLGVSDPVSSIAVDPGNASIAYASLASLRNPILLVTYNEGATWQILPMDGISSTSIDVIGIQPTSGTIYLGTDNGVYDSTNGGLTWTVAGLGLPNVAVFDIAFTASGNVVAATHGRGAWLLSSSNIGNTSSSNTTIITTITNTTSFTTSTVSSAVTIFSSSTNSTPSTTTSLQTFTTQSSANFSTTISSSYSLSSQSSSGATGNSTASAVASLSSCLFILFFFFISCASYLEFKGLAGPIASGIYSKQHEYGDPEWIRYYWNAF